MNIGWIKIHRSILNHWIYTEKRKFSKFEAWQDMLLNVNYSDNKVTIKGKLYDVLRGQSALSLDSWAKRWNWDKSSVRRFFNLLEKDEMIIVKSDNITTHLTICKYEDYQQSGNADETQTKHKRNTNEIQTTPIKEGKESKEEKEAIPSVDEFVAYAISLKSNVNIEQVKFKYNAWLVNDWKVSRKGKEQKIINWKKTLSNTMQYFDHNGDFNKQSKPNSTVEDYKNMFL